ncbi:MAG: CRISPR-associated endonuclease Cas6 [Thermodesulfobacteriota bacterium]|nr:CRISPR-associated endonuclease Cas6 [Thermodesulfobacteriota bacterium]
MDNHLMEEQHFIQITVARLYTDQPFQGNGGDLRRTVTAHFPDIPLLHHHNPAGESDYSLPQVRYLVIHKIPHLVGLNRGRKMVAMVAEKTSELTVGRQSYDITGHDFIEEGIILGLSSGLTTYTNRSPWLALNQNNANKFQKLSQKAEKRELLERILIGNFLSLAKGLDIRLQSRILLRVVSFHWRKIKTPNSLLGFQVSFVSNLILPEFLGLGKMVSKGYGLMKKQE